MQGTLAEREPHIQRIRKKFVARGRDVANDDFASSISFGESDPARIRALGHAASRHCEEAAGA